MSIEGTYELLFPFSQFEVERILGKLPSGRAVSWLSRNKENDTRVVIKEVSLADSIGHEAWLERKWTGWARIHEIRAGQFSAIYIRDYIEGERLDKSHGGMDCAAALTRLAGICATLAPLHALNLAHGRIKPNNIIVATDQQIILTDPTFDPSQAASRPEDEDTADASIAFDPYYISPEQIRGDPATPASDVYSLGCILYEMLAGKPPFRNVVPLMICYQHAATPPPDLATAGVNVAPDVSGLVMRMLAKAPDKRPQFVEEVLDLIEPLLDPAYSPAAMTGTFSFSPADLEQSPKQPIHKIEKPESAKTPDPTSEVATEADEEPAQPPQLQQRDRSASGTLVISRRELKKLIERADNKTYKPGDTPVLDPDERLPIPLVRQGGPASSPAIGKPKTAVVASGSDDGSASEAPTGLMTTVQEKELSERQKETLRSTEITQADPAPSRPAPSRSAMEGLLWVYSIVVSILLIAAIVVIVMLLVRT